MPCAQPLSPCASFPRPSARRPLAPPSCVMRNSLSLTHLRIYGCTPRCTRQATSRCESATCRSAGVSGSKAQIPLLFVSDGYYFSYLSSFFSSAWARAMSFWNSGEVWRRAKPIPATGRLASTSLCQWQPEMTRLSPLSQARAKTASAVAGLIWDIRRAQAQARMV